MLLHIPEVLSIAQSQEMRRALVAADWIDGRVTAGNQSVQVKCNMQVPEDHPTARDMGALILGALHQNALFLSAALPHRVFPPLFSRYEPGESFGTHIDNAIRQFPGSGVRMRTDLAATLFLSDPETYDGGELVIEDTYGVHSVKLPAGDLVLYPASSLHHVRRVSRGVRTYLSSGFKVWCATTAAGRCCSISIMLSSRSAESFQTIQRPFN